MSDAEDSAIHPAALQAVRHATLMRRVAECGDREAFAELFAYFAPRLKGFLLRSGALTEQADDLSQEVMLLVWRKAGQFDAAKAGVSTWIYTIARNCRIDAARRGVLETVPDDVLDLLATADAAPTSNLPGSLPAAGAERSGADGAFGWDSTESAAALQQRAARVQRAVEKLPDEQSRVVLLAFFHGKAHGDVARDLNLPLGTVKSRLRLASKKLRTLLGDFSE